MKVANSNIINIAAKSYNSNLLSLVPPNSQIEEQPAITICESNLSQTEQSFNLSSKPKLAKRKKKLQQRKNSKTKKQKAWLELLPQHETLLNIIDSLFAQRDDIFNAKTREITESERQNIGHELATEVAEKENKMDSLL